MYVARGGFVLWHTLQWDKFNQLENAMRKDFLNYHILCPRFWSKVDKTDEGGCWIWTAGKNKNGYGAIGVDCRIERAHRVSWFLHFGPIPEKMHVLHKCDNPACVAPHHLFLGDHLTNMLDKEAKGRANQPIGARNKASKLTVEMVREIKLSNESQQILAERYGVTDGAINHIKMGRTWKHVV